MHISVERGALVRVFGTGPTLVCLHGFADHGTMFLPLAGTAAAKRFQFVVPDLPGFGASPWDSDLDSIDGYAEWLNFFVREVDLFGAIGIVAHSAASVIAVRAVQRDPSIYCGLFSIEGNLTAADAFFSGKAAEFDDSAAFQASLRAQIWANAKSDESARRYYGAIGECDARAMWHFGRAVKAVSSDEQPGLDFARLPIPARYYWSSTSTNAITREFIEYRGLDAVEYQGGHMPMLEAPSETAAAITDFFDAAFKAAEMPRREKTSEWN